jgi:hypothetical protein
MAERRSDTAPVRQRRFIDLCASLRKTFQESQRAKGKTESKEIQTGIPYGPTSRNSALRVALETLSLTWMRESRGQR